MNWNNNYFKDVFFTWIDAGIVILVFLAFVVSNKLSPFLFEVILIENQVKIGVLVVIIAISNLLLYKKLLPKFTNSYQYKE